MSYADAMRKDLLSEIALESERSGLGKTLATFKVYFEAPKMFRYAEDARIREGTSTESLIPNISSKELFELISNHVRDKASAKGITIRQSWSEFHAKHGILWAGYQQLASKR